MVKAGLAEVYRGPQPRYFNVKIYQDAEAEVKKANKYLFVLERSLGFVCITASFLISG
jgi:hypothetical protein